MLVSIIIPSFRQPQFLERAIASCLEQDHDELEVIVIEDRSRDASLGIAVAMAAVDPRVRVVPCPSNGGLGKARNIGIAHARGDLLCFLDSDDYLLDRSLSARIEAWPAAVAEHGDAVVGVYGDWQHVPESIDFPTVRKPRASMPLVSSKNYTGENVFICSAPLVQRAAVLEAGGFPEGLRMLEDFALWAKMIGVGGVFVPVHHVVSTYRQRPNSMLRGDGVVVMSDHADVINDWFVQSGGSIADGGAMTAWLEDRDPRQFGRMSWSVPSILGSFGGGPGAAAVANIEEPSADTKPPERPAMQDFMGEPVNSGLHDPPPMWSPDPSRSDALVLSVSSVQESLEAVALVTMGRDVGREIEVNVPDPSDWFDIWPLALADIAVTPRSKERPADFATADLDHELRKTLVAHAVDELWPDAVQPAGSCVYVPREMAGHPGLDAWLSTSLHALADCGLDPIIVADPRARAGLLGYRSALLSIDRVRSFTTIVAPTCSDLSLLELLAPTVVFDPFEQTGDHPRTRRELDVAIESLDRSWSSLDKGVDDAGVGSIQTLLDRLVERPAP